MGWDLLKAALLIALPLTIGRGVIVPVYACRKVGIPLGKYIRGAFLGPSLCILPFALCLILSRILFADNVFAVLGYGSAAGALILGLLYWRYILPENIRGRIICTMRKKLRQGLSHVCKQ